MALTMYGLACLWVFIVGYCGRYYYWLIGMLMMSLTLGLTLVLVFHGPILVVPIVVLQVSCSPWAVMVLLACSCLMYKSMLCSYQCDY